MPAAPGRCGERREGGSRGVGLLVWASRDEGIRLCSSFVPLLKSPSPTSAALRQHLSSGEAIRGWEGSAALVIQPHVRLEIS